MNMLNYTTKCITGFTELHITIKRNSIQKSGFINQNNWNHEGKKSDYLIAVSRQRLAASINVN